ncbi:RNA-binding (RRM/RBD/RNP motifs) family protein [Striga asiatica]|uniref:RNA-binding (RRM/RBD/RNP motifs) family protein n=1 Tax=Striga asiatica TaxID=4170 RepID=A0A5A7PNJ0_STRAF|nr:RNA-binding (RRM/RBD/RNP motifs) family protein [Striga asiatica]
MSTWESVALKASNGSIPVFSGRNSLGSVYQCARYHEIKNIATIATILQAATPIDLFSRLSSFLQARYAASHRTSSGFIFILDASLPSTRISRLQVMATATLVVI